MLGRYPDDAPSSAPRTQRRKILLIIDNIAPTIGGSAVVYDAIARHAHGRVVVLASKHDYRTGAPLPDMEVQGCNSPYEILRISRLRTDLQSAPSVYAAPLTKHGLDTLIRARVLTALSARIVRGDIGAVCIGELVALGWLLPLLRRLPGIATLVYAHGEELTLASDYDPDWSRRRRTLLAADRIIVVSDFTAGIVNNLLSHAATERLRVIRNGVDTRRFMPQPRPVALAKRYGVQNSFTYLSIARLLEKKGIDHAIEAFAAVSQVAPDSRFLIVGDGPDRRRLHNIAAVNGVADRVVFTGAVAGHELAAHYALGDVFVMPNRQLPNGDTEGFGLVFLEANACGLPVIAGQDGGTADAVKDGINGLRVDGQSVAAIADAMLRLQQNLQMHARLKAGGLLAAAGADWQTAADAFLNVVDAISSGKGR